MKEKKIQKSMPQRYLLDDIKVGKKERINKKAVKQRVKQKNNQNEPQFFNPFFFLERDNSK